MSQDKIEDQLKNIVARLSKTKSQEELDGEVNKIKDEIEEAAYQSRAGSLPKEVDETADTVAASLAEFLKYYRKDESSLHLELEGKRTEFKHFEMEATDLTRKIAAMTEELKTVARNRDYKKLQYERLKNVEQMLKFAAQG